MKRTLTFFSILFILFLILQRGSGIITKIILANAITAEEYAIITLVAISIPAFLQILTISNFYYILSHSQEGRRYFGFSVLASMTIFFVISVILLFFSDQLYAYLNLPAEHASLFTFTILLTLGSLTLLTDIQGLFTGLKSYSVSGIVLALPSFARVGLIIFLALAKTANLYTAILAYALSNIIPFIVFLLVPRFRNTLRELWVFAVPSRKMLAFGTSLVIVTSVPTIGQSLARIAISHQIGVLWQGYFDVSLTLTSLLIFSIGTLGFISLPESTTGDDEAIVKRGGLADVSRLLLAFTVLAAIVLSVYAHEIVVFLFSTDFDTAAEYVPVLVISYLFLFFELFLVNLNMASASTPKHYLVPSLISVLVLPFFFFVAEWSIILFRSAGYGNGLIGAYLSYTILVVFLTLLIVLFTHDRSPLGHLFQGIWRLVLPSLAIGVPLALFHPAPLFGITLACGLFFVAIFSTQYIDIGLIKEMISEREQ